MSNDFPHWKTVYGFFRRANKNGLWDKILQHVVKVTRKNAGLEENPTVALIDSQTVQNSSSSEQSGYDPGKFVYSTIKKFCADGGYRKTFIAQVSVG